MASSSPRASRAAGRRKQSSTRNETNPGAGAMAKAAAIYSMDFLSKEFWDKSKNWRLFAYLHVTCA